MGVVTSSRKDHFDLIHQTTGLLEYFDFVLTADDFRRVKPDPEPYLLAVAGVASIPARAWRLKTRNAVFQSATSAGISCVVVPSALTRGGTLRRGARHPGQHQRDSRGAVTPADRNLQAWPGRDTQCRYIARHIIDTRHG